MSEQRPEGDLLSRPEVRAGAAAIGGGLLAALIVLVIVLVFGGDGDGGDEQAVTTPFAATATPGEGATAGPTAVPTTTGTPAGPTDPLEALAAFISEEFDTPHIGDCPQEIPPEGVPEGFCSLELHRVEEFAAYFIGPAFSEAVGEAVLTRRPDGSWEVTFVGAPPLGEEIVLNEEAMVYGVGSCLNFREEPSASAERITCQPDGTRAQVVEGPVEEQVEEGPVTWWRLEGLGWASDQYLSPVGE